MASNASANMTHEERSALLVVDVQKDFCPGGALAVPEGDRVARVLNRYIGDAIARGWVIYASRDWHPPVTRHFLPFGGEWPVHCVQHTDGARFHDELRLPGSVIVISKGQSAESPGYSAFEGLTPDGKTFETDLHERRIEHLFVGGLATDYCVKHSVLGALRSGLKVTVLADVIAGVDLHPGDSAQAIAEMATAGAEMSGSPNLSRSGHRS
jgi:nicotinamidase/pyrazinamidase